jgi:ketosteroid isomerase-like protein
MPIEGAVLQADHRSPHTDDAVLQSGATVFTVAEAKAIVRRITRAAASMDPDAIADFHTEDCVVAFVQGPELHGRLAVRDFMASRPRSGRVGYVCDKALRAMNGNVLCVLATSAWTDRDTGKRMRTRGVEIFVLRGEEIARTDGALNTWEE